MREVKRTQPPLFPAVNISSELLQSKIGGFGGSRGFMLLNDDMFTGPLGTGLSSFPSLDGQM
jgi:hypothetical protein